MGYSNLSKDFMWTGSDNSEEDHDGLPDAAFTQDELDAGVQHIMRSGRDNPSQSQSGGCPRDDDEACPRPQPSSSIGFAPHFSTFALAQSWAKANPGCSFSRAIDGSGFVGRPKASIGSAGSDDSVSSRAETPTNHEVGRREPGWIDKELKQLSPYTRSILECWGNSRGYHFTHVFSELKFNAEITRLGETKCARLRYLLSEDLRWQLNLIEEFEKATRRNRRMMSGHHGEPEMRAVNERIRLALALIDVHTGNTW